MDLLRRRAPRRGQDAGLKIPKETQKALKRHAEAIGKLGLAAITASSEKLGTLIKSAGDVLGVGALL